MYTTGENTIDGLTGLLISDFSILTPEDTRRSSKKIKELWQERSELQVLNNELKKVS